MDEDQIQIPAASLKEYLRNARESGKIFRWVWREVTTPESRRRLYYMFALTIFTIVMQTLQVWQVNYILTGLTLHRGQAIVYGLGGFLACMVISKIAECFQDSQREWIIGLNWARLDDRLTELFLGKSLGQHIHEGNRLSVSNIDKGRWQTLGLQGMILFDATGALLQLLIAYVALFCLDWHSGFVMTIVISVYLSWSMYLNLKVNQECTPIDRDFRKLNRRRIERQEKVERVKIAGREAAEVGEMSAIFGDVMHRDRTFWLWYIRQSSLRGIVTIIGHVTVMCYGSYLVWNGHWTIGLLYPLFMWTSRVSENIWRVGYIERQISWAMPAVKSMIKALELEPDIVDPPNAIELKHGVPHRIEFRDVSHTYPTDAKKKKANPPVLSNVSFIVEPGEKVALLGPSGAGKTTIMRLLLRYHNPSAGQILVGGRDIREIAQTSWYKNLGYISQQPQVIDHSIRYNLKYNLSPQAQRAVSDDDVWALMRLLKIDFKDRLTDGLDTVVGKNGVKLSGGEAQRLMIGAAVIARPSFLIVDEATASLDSGTEMEVQQGLATLLSSSETSALIIAHRLSTVRSLCQKFIVLRPASEVVNGDSQIEAVAGSFEELYRISPTFRHLADCQHVKVG